MPRRAWDGTYLGPGPRFGNTADHKGQILVHRTSKARSGGKTFSMWGLGRDGQQNLGPHLSTR